MSKGLHAIQLTPKDYSAVEADPHRADDLAVLKECERQLIARVNPLLENLADVRRMIGRVYAERACIVLHEPDGTFVKNYRLIRKLYPDFDLLTDDEIDARVDAALAR